MTEQREIQNDTPLHRRVKMDGISGRFLRAVVVALSGTTAGSAHLLIDVSHTPVSSQLDARALAAFSEAVGNIFGLSADILVCHAQTTIADLACGDRVRPAQAAVGGPPNASPAPSPQLNSQPHPTTNMQPIAAQPTFDDGRLEQADVVNDDDDDVWRPGSVGDGDDPASSSFDARESGSALQPSSEQPLDSFDPDPDQPTIPQPPPLPTHVHAPRRQPSNDHPTAGIEAANRFRDGRDNISAHLHSLDHCPDGGRFASSHILSRHFSGGFPDSSPMSPSDFPTIGGSYARGPIFSNIFIAHHIHNASREVQDVLLQALKLKQMSVDGMPVNLPAIHLCIATHSSTVRHPNARLSTRLADEFVVDLHADANFFQTFERFIHESYSPLSMYRPSPPAAHLPIPWQSIRQVVNEDEISAGIHMSMQIGQYIRDIAIALRQHGRVAFGPSPQGVQAFIHAAKSTQHIIITHTSHTRKYHSNSTHLHFTRLIDRSNPTRLFLLSAVPLRCHAFFSGYSFVRPADVDGVAGHNTLNT